MGKLLSSVAIAAVRETTQSRRVASDRQRRASGAGRGRTRLRGPSKNCGEELSALGRDQTERTKQIVGELCEAGHTVTHILSTAMSGVVAEARRHRPNRVFRTRTSQCKAAVQRRSAERLNANSREG